MAVPSELPYEVQQREARRRATAKAKNGFSSMEYLTLSFLSHFPMVMESKEDDVTWNEVSRLFRRCDVIPATFIDQVILVQEVDLGVFGDSGTEIAERRAPCAGLIQTGDR